MPGHAPGPTPISCHEQPSPRGTLAEAVAAEPPDPRPAARCIQFGWVHVTSAPSVTLVTFPPTLHTARLTLDPYRMADEEDFVAFFQDTRVSQFMGDGPQTEAADRALFHRVFPVYAEQRFAVWAVRRDGRLIGHAEIKHTDTVDGHEIVYALAADQWGEGLGTELARAIIGYGWDTLGLEHVHATVDDANVGSSILLQRLGFEHARNIAEDAGIVRVYTLARP